MTPPRARAAAWAAALLLAVAVLTIVPASGGAFTVGVGDQNPALFADPYFQQLDPGTVRYIASYDAALRPADRRSADAWMHAARAAGKQIVVAFNPPGRMRCPNLHGARGCRPVPVAAYRRAFRAFHARYPYVRIVQPWNEVNNITQPTSRHPEAVVAYYDVVRRACRGCTVLGADIQDLPNMATYTKRLLRAFRRRRIPLPRLWGMHNYTDTNRFLPDRRSGLRKLVRLLPGRLWLTETGGLYRFRPANARQSFHPDLDRQRRAMAAVFAAARKYRRKVARVYVYNWFGAPPTNRWDSGVLDLTGAPRPAFAVLERYARAAGRR